MRAKTVAQLLADLGVTKTHARPYTPDDNPYSEAQFKTMKYRPDYPDRFDSLDHARSWARAFFAWYNREHHHTGLGLMTPAVVHYEHVDEVRAKRQRVLDAAYVAHPERFVKGRPIAPNAPDQVWINPPQPVPVASTAPTETQPVAEVLLTVGPATSDNAEFLAVVEGPLWPSTEEKSSLAKPQEPLDDTKRLLFTITLAIAVLVHGVIEWASKEKDEPLGRSPQPWIMLGVSTFSWAVKLAKRL
jgi:hypothetical protein